MVNKRSKIFTSLIIFSLIFSVWLPSAFADEEPALSEEELLEFCEIEEEIIEEELEEEIDEEEVLEDGPQEVVVEVEKESDDTTQNNDEEDIIIKDTATETEPTETQEEPKEKESNLAEDVKLKGIMPIIPMPKIKPLSNGGPLEDTIEINKNAKRLIGLCRQYEVTLDITGTPQEAPVDVVLIIDKSGSMNETTTVYEAITSPPSTNRSYYVKVNNSYRQVSYSSGGFMSPPQGWYYGSGNSRRYVTWDPNGNDSSAGSSNSNNPLGKPFYTQETLSRLDFAKEAAINFTGNVLDSSNGANNRVSLVTFSGPSTISGNGSQTQAQTVRGLTNDSAQLTNDINGISAVGGTNTEAGFLQGRGVIENSDRPYANKVVIMFTDGLPTASNGVKYEESTNINHVHNQAAINAGKGIFEDGVADVFTIGLLQGMNTTERNLALQILDLTQNKGSFEAPTAADLDHIFNTIATQLGYAATNAKVVDKIGDNFDLVLDSLPNSATYDSNTREISWNPGTITEEATLTYRVVAKPEFEGGDAFTNEFATLTYTDVFGEENQTKDFPKPKVDVPSLLEVELTDAEIMLGTTIALGIGTDPSGENYMDIYGGDGDGTYSYEWRVKGDTEIISTDRNPNVTPETDTTYVLTITDSNGCIAEAEIKITVRKLKVTVEKFITGNYADFEDEFDFTLTIGDRTETFKLGDDDEITFEDIAKDSILALTEDSKDYEVLVKVGNLVINDDDGVYTITMEDEDITITVTNDRTIEVDTGIVLDNLPYMILLSTALGFGIYITIRRKQRN